MLAYAARRSVAGRQSSPNTMLLIVAVHVAALALVMSAKMDFPRIFNPPITVDTIPAPKEPVAVPDSKPRPARPPIADPISRTNPQVPLPLPGPDEVGTAPAELLPGPAGGGVGTGTTQVVPPQPRAALISRGPQLLTPDSELKPPYPLAKQAFGKEATLTLKLMIDENGRVLTVDAIGRADRTFAEAARRHIIMHWRYRPALQNGHAVMSTTVITLAFRLDS
ncbi:MAG: energy transducer TonB [Pseudomonadota bacterium]